MKPEDKHLYPVKKVIRTRNVSRGSVAAEAFGLCKILHLECHHEIGLKEGDELPSEVPCRDCYRISLHAK